MLITSAYPKHRACALKLISRLAAAGLVLIGSLGCPKRREGDLLIAFPTSATQVRLVFSVALDRASAEDPRSYSTRSGLAVVAARLDAADRRRVTLTSEPMPTWETSGRLNDYDLPPDKPLTVDTVLADRVRTESGALLARTTSPPFVQGLPAAAQIQRPRGDVFPFSSPYDHITATAHYNKDGGADSNFLIDALGFAFLHRESGGPFNSIKIVTKKHVSGIGEAKARLQPGQGVHVMWAGGQVQTVDGETRLVDTGFMEGSVLSPPLKSPPPYPIKTAEIGGDAGRSLRAKSLQGVIVRFENVMIDSVTERDKGGLRRFVFHDDSGVRLAGLLLNIVTQELKAGQRFSALRAIVHQPRLAEYEALVEMDQHLVPEAGR